jgi:hypothetical protein
VAAVCLWASFPRSATMLEISDSLASSFPLTEAMPVSIRSLPSYLSRSWPKEITSFRRATFSARSRDTSASRCLIRRDCMEFARAISRFCRTNRRFTGKHVQLYQCMDIWKRSRVRHISLDSQDSTVSAEAGTSFSRAMGVGITSGHYHNGHSIYPFTN